MPKHTLISDQTVLDCAVVLRVQVVRNGQVFERFDSYPIESCEGMTVTQVGTHLQAQVYESLKLAYTDALNEGQK